MFVLARKEMKKAPTIIENKMRNFFEEIELRLIPHLQRSVGAGEISIPPSPRETLGLFVVTMVT